VWAAAAVGLLLAIFFSPIVRDRATFSSVANLQRYYYPWIDTSATKPPDAIVPQWDQADYVYPRQVFLDTTLRRTGQLPLWIPDTLGGIPFMAETGSRLGYPPMLAITFLFNPVHAHDVYLIVHLLFAGMAMFALMKAFGVRFGGALLSAVSWTFASYTTAWMMLEMFVPVAALLPLALLFIYRWDNRESRSDLAAASFVLGLLLLGSSVEVAFLAFMVVAGYTGILGARRLLARRSSLGRRDLVRGLAEPALMAASSLAMAAVVLLPLAALSNSSQRGALSVEYQLKYSVPAKNFAGILRPPAIPRDARRVSALLFNQVFVGTATACFAIVGLTRRHPGRGLGAALVVVLFLFATGSVVARAMYFGVPFLSRLAGAGRGIFVFDLGLAILGGLGLDIAVGALRRVGPVMTAVRWPGTSSLSLGEVAAAVLTTVCVVFTSVQLLSYGRRVNPPFQSRESAALFPSTPVVDAVKDVTARGAGRERVLVLGPVTGPHALAGITGLALDLSLVNGYEPLVPAKVKTIWRVVDGEQLRSALETPWKQTFQLPFMSSTIRTDLLGRLGVAAIVAPPGDVLGPGWSEAEAARRGLVRTYAGTDGQVFTVADRAPRAVVVDNATWAATPADALGRFTAPDFDVRREVVLEGRKPPTVETHAPEPGGVPARVDWLQDDPNQVRVSVTAPRAGWMVLLDNWDEGWEATIGGRPVKVERANFTQRAVRVPAGTSTVTFSYRPADFRIGAVVSTMTTVALVAVMVVGEARRRRRRTQATRQSPEHAVTV